jgi:hypothetical protein
LAGKKTVPVAVAITAVLLTASIVTAILVFGPKTVGPVLEEEKPMIEAWLAWSGLDAYGGNKGASYPEGLPEDRYDYIRSNHRDRPWNSIDPVWLTTFAPGEMPAFDAWVKANNLNDFGDPIDTMYAGGTPLFNEMTGESIPLEAYALKNHPLRPWNNEEAK